MYALVHIEMIMEPGNKYIYISRGDISSCDIGFLIFYICCC